MKTVYIIIGDGAYGGYFHSVWSSREKAEEAVEKHTGYQGLEILEEIVDGWYD